MTLEQHAEAIVKAIDEADPGHSIALTRLVDGEATYSARVGGQCAEFPDMDEAREWVRQVKASLQSEAILTACAALFDAGAVAMREEVEKVLDQCREPCVFCTDNVGSIDHASLRKDV